MLVSNTPPIRYDIDAAPICIRYATWRIVDFFRMLTLRYGSDTPLIRSRYARDIVPIRQGVTLTATKREEEGGGGRRKKEEGRMKKKRTYLRLQLLRIFSCRHLLCEEEAAN
ncbi:hypothetical protein L3X38_034294 [Prunus dulcis]|uniref:Uncharacterized protein n=1 Tax=Prunus dulcis TaxID=3755 RepID=A0AAD4VHL0_PRUDU|nr:hypothetical protein L3X38_034294 [Prunus dulcis]